jgi:PAS domain S-box-containing protein
MVNTLDINQETLQQLQQRSEVEGISIDAMISGWLENSNPSGIQRLEATIGCVTDAVIVVDFNLIITEWNKAAETIYGWTESEAIGQEINQLLQTEWLYGAREQTQLSLIKNNHWHGELQQTTRDGRKISIWTSSSWLKDGNGKNVGGVAINRDITEEKRVREALQKREEQYRLLVENTEDVISLFDADFNLLYISPSCEKMMGYTHTDFQSMSVMDLLHPEELDGFLEKLNQDVVSGKSVSTYEHRFRHKDGHYIWVESVSNRRFDADGVDVETLVSTRDVTERKLADQRIRRMEERFSKVFHSSPSVMLLSNLEDGRIIEVNALFEEMFGFNRSEIIGKTTIDLGIWLDPKKRPDLINQLKTHQSIRNLEFPIVTKSGEKRIMLGAFEVLVLDNETRLLATFIDISERKKVELALQESELRLRQAMNVAQIGIWNWDITTDVVQWYGHMFDIYGVTPEEFTGLGSDYIHFTREDYRAKQQTDLVNLVNNGVTEE